MRQVVLYMRRNGSRWTRRETDEEGDDRVSMRRRGGWSRRKESRLEARGAVRGRHRGCRREGIQNEKRGFLMLPRRVVVVS